MELHFGSAVFIKLGTSLVHEIFSENQLKSLEEWSYGPRGIVETMHFLIFQASDWNYQNSIITTIGILTSSYDH